jgi:CheY-like chemotaxis protein
MPRFGPMREFAHPSYSRSSRLTPLLPAHIHLRDSLIPHDVDAERIADFRRLVELHGATVDADSDGPGKGSRFTVRLPLVLKDEGGSMNDEKEGSALSDSSFIPHPSSLAVVARALVIDDNFDAAETTTWLLEGFVREVKMVQSGQAALDLVTQWRPDFILCDLGMPGMDGYETCRRLRRVPGMEKVVIAVVSGYGGPEDRKKSLEAGFDYHLVKPIGRAELDELVKSVGARDIA